MGADPVSQPAAQGHSVTRLGVVAALPAEAECFIGRRTVSGALCPLPGGGWLTVAGIGNARALRAATGLDASGATAFLSWGTAGGLDLSLRPGTVILPKRIICPAGRSVVVDAAWREALWCVLERHVALCDGAVVDSQKVLTGPQDKAILRRRSGAAAVDMESAAIGTVAQRRAAPFLVVRVIVDPGWQAVPRAALTAVDGDGRLCLRHLLFELAREPRQLVALARLAVQFRAAKAALTTIANVGMPALCAPPAVRSSLVRRDTPSPY